MTAVDKPDKYHFVYKKPDSEDLQQGDLLRKTPDLVEILQEVHPHYRKDDYTHLLVLSQSCDLVRRRGQGCKARYITLAAVRPFKTVIDRHLQEYQESLDRKAMVCSNDHRSKFTEFVTSLLNNSIQAEYFYLHDEPSLGLTEKACAFLRLSIAIKADLHYLKCLGSRMLSLQDVYQAKLGWLVGNMYSRVGVEDWVPRYVTKEEFKKIVRNLVDGACKWVESGKLIQARSLINDERIVSSVRDELRGHIDSVEVVSARTAIIASVVEELAGLNLFENEAVKDQAIRRISNNEIFKKYTKS